jgi:hypothetical protein
LVNDAEVGHEIVILLFVFVATTRVKRVGGGNKQLEFRGFWATIDAGIIGLSKKQ